MYRFLLITTAAAIAATAAPAMAQTASPFGAPGTIGSPNQRYDPSLNLGSDRTGPAVASMDSWRATQLVRWGAVGRCVVAKDRDGSAAFVAARRGSDDADAAAKRLDSAFTSCLAGSGVVGQRNAAYRRAALADALAK